MAIAAKCLAPIDSYMNRQSYSNRCIDLLLAELDRSCDVISVVQRFASTGMDTAERSGNPADDARLHETQHEDVRFQPLAMSLESQVQLCQPLAPGGIVGVHASTAGRLASFAVVRPEKAQSRAVHRQRRHSAVFGGEITQLPSTVTFSSMKSVGATRMSSTMAYSTTLSQAQRMSQLGVKTVQDLRPPPVQKPASYNPVRFLDRFGRSWTTVVPNDTPAVKRESTSVYADLVLDHALMGHGGTLFCLRLSSFPSPVVIFSGDFYGVASTAFLRCFHAAFLRLMCMLYAQRGNVVH